MFVARPDRRLCATTRQKRNERSAFSLVEVLIVIVLMAILASIVTPRFFDSLQDADLSVALNNLQNMRLIIERYRGSHHGISPSATLVELINRTNDEGEIGTTAEHRYGPYVTNLPANPLNGQDSIRVITTNQPTAADATGKYGWLYHPPTGHIFLDDPEHFAS